MKLLRYLRKLYRSKFWSDLKLRNEAMRISHLIYDALDAEFGEELTITSGNGVVVFIGRYDEDRENVLALLHIDLLSNTAQIKCNELGDYLGLGRSVKKLLEQLKFHVYYTNTPIALINGVVAHGNENVQSLQMKSGGLAYTNQLGRGRTKHETIH